MSVDGGFVALLVGVATATAVRVPGRVPGTNERRGWDLNPRTALRQSAVFKTAPFGRSGTPPSAKGSPNA